MPPRLQKIAWLVLLAIGCGTGGDPGGGSSHLPVSGAGPFRPLPPDPDVPITPPIVLLDPTADLDDPFVLADGDLMALWVTTTRKTVTGTRVEHSDAYKLTDGFLPLIEAINPDQSWEAGAVSSPSVIRAAPWILFYGGGGAIGWATAADGHTWVKAPGPALEANNLEEGHLLASPSAVRIDDRVRVYYLAENAVWAAEAPFADVAAGRAATWTRVDGDPSTPARDPMLDGNGLTLATSTLSVGVSALARVTARAGQTPAGRVRHDLYYTAMLQQGPTTAGKTGMSTCGFASSFTGDRFALGPAPILPIMQTTRSPAETPYRDGAVLLYVESDGARQAIAAATSP
jgi:hypothetical protein